MKPATVQSSATIPALRNSSTFCKKLSIICCFTLLSKFSFAQVDSVTSNKKRVIVISAVNAVGYGGSLIILNNTWYKNYPHSSFHTFNDSKEWLQVDKVGHAWTAYNTGRASTAMWRWAGLNDKKAALIGGLSGPAYLTVVELLDAHSTKWGWSWA